MKTSFITFLFVLAVDVYGQARTFGTYTQNFDTLAATGTHYLWNDNSTLPSWYGAINAIDPYVYYVRSGVTDAFGPISYGNNADRALGLGTSSRISSSSVGIRFFNPRTRPLYGFSVQYDGEQWGRRANSTPAPDKLYFSYKIYSTSPGATGLIENTDWISVPALDFISPNWAEATEASLDGNAAGNRTAGLYSLITGTQLARGEEIWLRWTAYNEGTGSHDLAIDNISVTFFTTPIPEPASLATLCALAVVGVAGLRRRRPCVH